eukprot:scaffold19245_cov199-Amphora_coffeaeformis.AAC.27
MAFNPTRFFLHLCTVWLHSHLHGLRVCPYVRLYYGTRPSEESGTRIGTLCHINDLGDAVSKTIVFPLEMSKQIWNRRRGRESLAETKIICIAPDEGKSTANPRYACWSIIGTLFSLADDLSLQRIP